MGTPESHPDVPPEATQDTQASGQLAESPEPVCYTGCPVRQADLFCNGLRPGGSADALLISYCVERGGCQTNPQGIGSKVLKHCGLPPELPVGVTLDMRQAEGDR